MAERDQIEESIASKRRAAADATVALWLEKFGPLNAPAVLPEYPVWGSVHLLGDDFIAEAANGLVEEPSENPDSVADLRARIAELTAQIESLTPKPVPEKPKFPFAALTQPNNDIRMGAARYMVE